MMQKLIDLFLVKALPVILMKLIREEAMESFRSVAPASNHIGFHGCFQALLAHCICLCERQGYQGILEGVPRHTWARVYNSTL